MLKVKTFVMESSIKGAGLGLFAKEFIPKGTIIWEYDPNLDREYTQEEYDSFEDLGKEFIKTYAYKFESKYILCVDNARFFNHSNTPNCYTDFTKTNLKAVTDQSTTRALVDIYPGNELTDNYGQFSVIEEEKSLNLDIF